MPPLERSCGASRLREEERKSGRGGFGCPRRVFHIVLESTANVAGNVDRLYFQRAIVGDAALGIGNEQDHINAAHGFAVLIRQAHLRDALGVGAHGEEKPGGVSRNQPFLLEPDGTGDDTLTARVEDAAHAERVILFVFVALLKSAVFSLLLKRA